jgi:hypothetical protein
MVQQFTRHQWYQLNNQEMLHYRALSLATHLVASMPVFARDFVREGAIEAVATILVASTSRSNVITQNRAAFLLAAIARYPALQAQISGVANNAPALREAASQAAALAKAASAAKSAIEYGEGSEEGREGTEEGMGLNRCEELLLLAPFHVVRLVMYEWTTTMDHHKTTRYHFCGSQ